MFFASPLKIRQRSCPVSKIPLIVGTFEPGIASREGGHVYEDVSGTLRADPGDNRMTVYGSDHYNQNLYDEVEPTLGINCGTSTGRNGVVIRMDNKHEQDMPE